MKTSGFNCAVGKKTHTYMHHASRSVDNILSYRCYLSNFILYRANLSYVWINSCNLILLRGNFKMYVSYQPMAIPLVVAVILCIHLQFMKKPLKEISAAIVGATLFLNTVFYILRL